MAILQVTKKVAKCRNYRGILLLSTPYKILSNILLPRFSPYTDEILGITSVGLDITDQLMIRFSAFVRHKRKIINIIRIIKSMTVESASGTHFSYWPSKPHGLVGLQGLYKLQEFLDLVRSRTR
jgi:hypothetical protein